MNYFLTLIIIPFCCYASVDIAFIEIRSPDGRLVQLEKNGRFAHIAIAYRGQWLHAGPYKGVEIISTRDLQKIGRITILNISNKSEPSKTQVQNVLGKPYDNHFSWDDDHLYCSELVAKILGIPPEPMTFNSSIWPTQSKYLKGNLGLSPDDIFRKLQNN